MNDIQRRRFERLVRAADDTSSLADPFPLESKGGKALANIRGFIEELESKDASLVTNVTSKRQGTLSRKEAREGLREQLNAIFETSETIALDHTELKGKFRRPASNSNDQTLISVGRSYAAEALPIKNLFLEYHMPTDFIDRLGASVDAFEQSINQQNTGADATRSSRVSIDTILDSAEEDLERLDTAMRNKYRNDKATLAAWESANRLERTPRKKKETPPPSTPQT